MRIIIGSETYPPHINGCSYFSKRLAEGLTRRGHEVHVLCLGNSLSYSVYNDEGVVIHRLPSLGIPLQRPYRFSWPTLIRGYVKELIPAIGPDIVHVQNHFSIGRVLISTAKRTGVPVVASNHFMPVNLTVYLHLPRPVERFAQRCLWYDFGRVYRLADILTAPTRTASHLTRRHLGRRTFRVVSCGVDLSQFSPSAEPVAWDRPTCLYVGRLAREKNIDELIRAFRLVRQCMNAQLVIIGIGKHRRSLERLTRRCGVAEAVLFAGFVADADLPGYYSGADVFCMPSTAELQSIATMEAAAAGKPIVAAAAGALGHLVHDEENGYLFRPGNVKELAGHLATLLSDPTLRARMGAASLRIIRVHDSRAATDQYERLYLEALELLPRGDRLAELPLRRLDVQWDGG